MAFFTVLTITLLSAAVNAGASGTGSTTRYWDCCKPSCAWPGKASVSSPVGTCSINDTPLTDPNAASGCNGGSSYMCSSQAPWAINSTLAYGFAAVNIAGGSESSWCCACYALKFTSGPVVGKTLIVQATNTGGDLGSNQFDLAMPGGGVGIFNGCTAEWGAPSSGWGAQYGGVSSSSACSSFPSALQPGCDWRFDWFMGADNPQVSFEQVQCPAELTAKTGCTRSDDSTLPKANVGSAPASSPSTINASIAIASPSSVKAPVPVSPPVSSNTPLPAPPVSSKISSVPSSLSTVVKTVTASGPSVAQPSPVAKWGQCGGIGFPGSTTCITGSTCKYQNDWYSQCL